MKYYCSPRWSYEVTDCSMPLSFDTYSNCSYGCIYCFSQYQRGMGDRKVNYLKHVTFPVNADNIIEKFQRSLAGENAWKFSEYIRQRRVMQWGGLSDQFDENERVNGVTLKLLRFFKEINYPLCFSTKGTWWTEDKRYAELFEGQKNWNVKISIITLDEEKAKRVERRVPSPSERLAALKRVAEWDCGGATLRLRPFIIGISTPSYKDLINRAIDFGVTALSTEFFCMETRSPLFRKYKQDFKDLCGFDIFEFYAKYSTQTGYLRLNRNVKRPFVQEMKRICDERGIRFYVSDAHFKELCPNGSCCGLPEDWNYSRGQWTEAIMIAKKNGRVFWRDISSDILTFHTWKASSEYNLGQAEGRAKYFGMSMADYMHYLWNNPQRAKSPFKMFEGVLLPDGKDEQGNVIYRYNPEPSL